MNTGSLGSQRDCRRRRHLPSARNKVLFRCLLTRYISSILQDHGSFLNKHWSRPIRSRILAQAHQLVDLKTLSLDFLTLASSEFVTHMHLSSHVRDCIYFIVIVNFQGFGQNQRALMMLVYRKRFRVDGTGLA